ncbi:MAG: DEAD/DEAH box helicase [Microthrixaceae bacterium]
MNDTGGPSPAPSPPLFTLDRFQVEAIDAIDAGRSVLVAAPTGSGKTVVADAAVDRALRSGHRAFYTTPVKALSNQKFSDLRDRVGHDAVGLLTGDLSINGGARIVVMTTEVLRNMLYAGSGTLDDVRFVILDEVHFLQDAYRGPVWEEVIIGLPAAIRLVCLSATVSNAEELGRWIETVRGPTTTVVETERPVLLDHLYLVGDRSSPVDHLLPVLVDGSPNPEAGRFDRDPRLRFRGTGGRGRARYHTPRRLDVVERLADEDLLPTIYFIFSRAACDDALAAVRDSGMRFTSPAERREIRRLVGASTDGIGDADLDALGYDGWLQALEQGIASHHAGLIPAFKEAVERCFVRGLVKVVFATETLALGINMPARSVVIEKLSKFNGDTHEFLTPAQFTQLTGRAGRRGIDDHGDSIVLWSPFVSFSQVATLAASRDFPLTSSFRATYNMAANLVRRYTPDEATAVLNQSFAQFQADAAVVGLQRRIVGDTERIAALDEEVVCSRGDVRAYARLIAQVDRLASHRPTGRAAVQRSLDLVRPGDVLDLVVAPEAERHRIAVVSVADRSRNDRRVHGVDTSGAVIGIRGRDLAEPPRRISTIDLPEPYAPRHPDFLDAVAAMLGEIAIEPARTSASATSRRWQRAIAARDSHPVADCPDRDLHLAALSERGEVEADLERVRERLTRRTDAVTGRFTRVVALLTHRGYVDRTAGQWRLTEAGARLARIYHECDLLLAEALSAGVFDDIDPPSLASLVSALVYEERRPGRATTGAPTPELRRRLALLRRMSDALSTDEKAHGLTRTRAPDPGFMTTMYRWASGDELGDLVDSDLTGGDFVRTTRIVTDVVDQLAHVAPSAATRRAARDAVERMRRGVVAETGPVAESGDGPHEVRARTGTDQPAGTSDGAR